MLLLINPRDWVIRRYYLIDRGSRARALGRCGVASLDALCENAYKIDELDVSQYVGRSHDFTNYIICPDLMRAAWSVLTCETND